MYCSFSTITHGKWILAGEHAVLRGHDALVFPLKSKTFSLQYQPLKQELVIDLVTNSNSELKSAFSKALLYGQQLLDKNKTALTGHFKLDSNIPVSAGLGASAALCVAAARWFTAQQWLAAEETVEFARNLEGLFHGKSSGIDIAGASAKAGIYFHQGKQLTVKPHWQPNWYLSFSGRKGQTLECIKQVDTLWQTNKQQAMAIDTQMQAAVNQGKLALESKISPINMLAEAITQSADCFSQWGLMNSDLTRHIQLLLKHGAVAAKPTGSGGGGYVLSLWHQAPPNIDIEFIAI